MPQLLLAELDGRKTSEIRVPHQQSTSPYIKRSVAVLGPSSIFESKMEDAPSAAGRVIPHTLPVLSLLEAHCVSGELSVRMFRKVDKKSFKMALKTPF